MHSNRTAALLLAVAVFLVSALPAQAIFGKKEEMPTGGLTAEAMEVETYQNIPVSGELHAEGETDGELTFSLETEPKKGSVVLDGAHFTYTPTSGKSGKDSFRYVAIDSAGNTSAPAEVIIDIRKPKSAVSYSDMAGHAAHAAAVSLAEKGIYVGRQVGDQWLFEPEQVVSRSEFVAMAMKAADIAVSGDVTITGFADDESIPTWAKGCAGTAAQEGIVSGVVSAEGVRFCADAPITLSEAVTVMDRVLDVADVDVAETIGTGWAAQAAANMASVRVIAAGSFAESAPAVVTRAQAAQMLCAAMRVMASEKDSGGLFGWLK